MRERGHRKTKKAYLKREVIMRNGLSLKRFCVREGLSSETDCRVRGVIVRRGYRERRLSGERLN